MRTIIRALTILATLTALSVVADATRPGSVPALVAASPASAQSTPECDHWCQKQGDDWLCVQSETDPGGEDSVGPYEDCEDVPVGGGDNTGCKPQLPACEPTLASAPWLLAPSGVLRANAGIRVRIEGDLVVSQCGAWLVAVRGPSERATQSFVL